MMENGFAEKFAKKWIAAWNSHDMAEILSYYADDFELTSPAIWSVMRKPGGVLKGKSMIEAYWSKALALNPNLHFIFIAAFSGVDSVIVHYEGHRGLSAEVFHFDAFGKVYMSYAHYE